MIVHRVESVDIAKGVGIILVVFGHLIGYFDAPLQGLYPFIYLFHVPLFFFLSGLFFRQEEAWMPFLKKKFLRLYLPYALANVFFFFVEWTRIRTLGDAYEGAMSWSHLWQSVLGIWPMKSMLTMPTWFILVLFRACIIYKLLFFLLRNKRACVLLTCGLLAIAGIVLKFDYAMTGQTLVALPFFCLGHWIGPRFFNIKKIWDTVPSIVFFILSAATLSILSGHQKTNIAFGFYDHIILLFVGALLGIMMTLWGCSLLSKVYWFKKSLTYIGRHTLAILIWHVFVLLVLFKTAELITGRNEWPHLLLPLFYLSAFCLAIIIPCLLSIGWHSIVLRLKK